MIFGCGRKQNTKFAAAKHSKLRAILCKLIIWGVQPVLLPNPKLSGTISLHFNQQRNRSANIKSNNSCTQRNTRVRQKWVAERPGLKYWVVCRVFFSQMTLVKVYGSNSVLDPNGEFSVNFRKRKKTLLLSAVRVLMMFHFALGFQSLKFVCRCSWQQTGTRNSYSSCFTKIRNQIKSKTPMPSKWSCSCIPGGGFLGKRGLSKTFLNNDWDTPWGAISNDWNPTQRTKLRDRLFISSVFAHIVGWQPENVTWYCINRFRTGNNLFPNTTQTSTKWDCMHRRLYTNRMYWHRSARPLLKRNFQSLELTASACPIFLQVASLSFIKLKALHFIFAQRRYFSCETFLPATLFRKPCSLPPLTGRVPPPAGAYFSARTSTAVCGKQKNYQCKILTHAVPVHRPTTGSDLIERAFASCALWK